jgi:hypothetical protein
MTMFEPLTDDRGAAVVDVVSGGFPCQDISAQAGRRARRRAQRTLARNGPRGSRGSTPTRLRGELPNAHFSGIDRVLGDLAAERARCGVGRAIRGALSAPLTSASGSGLLPTPTTIDTGSRFNRSQSEGAALRSRPLGAMARFNLWPTPTVKGNHNRKGLEREERGRPGNGGERAGPRRTRGTTRRGCRMRRTGSNRHCRAPWASWKARRVAGVGG